MILTIADSKEFLDYVRSDRKVIVEYCNSSNEYVLCLGQIAAVGWVAIGLLTKKSEKRFCLGDEIVPFGKMN